MGKARKASLPGRVKGCLRKVEGIGLAQAPQSSPFAMADEGSQPQPCPKTRRIGPLTDDSIHQCEGKIKGKATNKDAVSLYSVWEGEAPAEP
jgi:hypothetical protein